MNKLINTLLISFLFINFCFCIKVKSNKDNIYDTNNSLLNLIVDSNKFNIYPVGGECGGNISFSCNNMADALNYANTLSGDVSQVGFLLVDGIYDFSNNSIQVFGKTIGIASFTQGSTNVIVKGGNKNNLPLINVDESINNVVVGSGNGITTGVSIYDITFQDCTSPIINVIVNLSVASIEFEGCNFSNFSTNIQNVSLINVWSNVTKTYPASISITNSYFTGSSGINNSFPVISISATTITLQGLTTSNISAQSFISSINSFITLSYSNFGSVATQYGVFKIQDTTFKSYGTGFSNCESSVSGSILTSLTTTDSNYFSFQNCQFNYCYSKNGGSIYASNIGQFQPTLSNINNCSFSGSYASNSGGVVYSINTPLNFSNSKFIQSNSAFNSGGLVYIVNSTLTIQTSTISSLNSSTQCDGYLVNTQGSNVFITNNTIGLMSGPPAISCSSSFVNISGISFMGTTSQISVTCNKCNIPNFCGNADGTSTGTTSFPTSSSQSSTTGGSATGGSTTGKQPFTVSSSSTTDGSTSDSSYLKSFNFISLFFIGIALSFIHY
ncbi:hypothetical protein DDB_G0279497 [Dictyostelium discoideum AX4]|uniref:Uncharacterized protein n=1 Tax=Dictyostelium discoideum TaxID=44689 RepID=Q54WQ5_DICDI|nr:hypothetical protein DDB_G0279497 [Dictyostelium discoideum AX4]EAL67687.1 hypothetical protein DDB_G0279497 [Dictyostelium discoideum AX4]|eukprot:XP_641662.1 hypothetical protein DDB_G0279497 [Dictyostelium discoideum AX4]